MKTGRFGPKKICKNGSQRTAKKYITSRKRKNPDIAAVWGRHYAGKSDKESSHVVGKIL